MEAAESVIERTRNFDFAEVLTRMAEERASDVHLSPGFCPAILILPARIADYQSG